MSIRKGTRSAACRASFVRATFQVGFLLLFLLPCYVAALSTTDYSRQISNADLNQLWVSKQLLVIEEDGKEQFIPRPEPLGFIGENYQRFYIHFITATRNPANHMQYLITGKTKVRGNVCDFKGTIIIKEARLEPSPEAPEYKTGYIAGEYRFEENRKQQGSGYFTGTFHSDWFIASDGKIRYDTLMINADGFSNNQFTGNWTPYATGKSKKCNWGDYRIPDCGDLDTYVGEFGVSDKYVKNGWESYMQAFWAEVDSPQSKRARAIEASKWWE